MKLTLIGLTALTVSLFACSSDTHKGQDSTKKETASVQEKMTTNETPEISVDSLHALNKAGHEFFLLDVRTDPEIAEARLSFIDGQVPYDVLADNLDRLPQDLDTEIYCFCRSSRRSGIATDYLRKVGYTNVYNVAGGIIAWQAAGYEIISGE